MSRDSLHATRMTIWPTTATRLFQYSTGKQQAPSNLLGTDDPRVAPNSKPETALGHSKRLSRAQDHAHVLDLPSMTGGAVRSFDRAKKWLYLYPEAWCM